MALRGAAALDGTAVPTYYEVTIGVMGGAGKPLAGVPVRVDVTAVGSGEVATIYLGTTSNASATFLLPLSSADAGSYNVTVTELLSGKVGTASVVIPALDETDGVDSPYLRGSHIIAASTSNVRRLSSAGMNTTIFNFDAVAQMLCKSGDRASFRLSAALTPAQQAASGLSATVAHLLAFAAANGRNRTDVSLALPINATTPTGAVVARQRTCNMMKYPQWASIDADLVVLGTAAANVLMYDQARGHLLPLMTSSIQPGAAYVSVTYSAFQPERWTLNIVASSDDDLVTVIESVLLQAIC